MSILEVMVSVTVEEYLRTSYEPEMEYVAGQLVDRHVGEYYHSLMQSVVAAELCARARERRYRAFIALRIQMGDAPRYRVPDVCVKALPYEVAPILTRPDLVVEILSTEDQVIDLLEKIGDYQAAGIPHIWVVDPYKRTLLVADQAGIRKPATQVLSTPLVGEVDFKALFQQLDEPAE